MTTSSSSVIIILVLNIFFSTPSFVSSTETRNDDLTLSEVQTVVQQQGALLQTLQAKLTADENTIHQQATLLQSLQAKVTADENIIHQQGVTIQTLQAKVTADESAIQQLQAKQSTMEARQNKNVAFTATFGSDNKVNIGQHGIIKFNDVITNIGGGYNSATGIFSAPFSGTYDFALHIRSDSVHNYIFVELTVNGARRICYTVVEGPAHDWYDKSSCSTAVHLNAGDQVFARQADGATYVEENQLTSFTGFLIRAD